LLNLSSLLHLLHRFHKHAQAMRGEQKFIQTAARLPIAFAIARTDKVIERDDLAPRQAIGEAECFRVGHQVSVLISPWDFRARAKCIWRKAKAQAVAMMERQMLSAAAPHRIRNWSR
jgi:hypothetical protein